MFSSTQEEKHHAVNVASSGAKIIPVICSGGKQRTSPNVHLPKMKENCRNKDARSITN